MSDNETVGVPELVEQLCSLDAGIQEVAANEAVQLLQSVARAHDLDADSCRWWGSLKNARTFPYQSDFSEWKERLSSLLQEMGADGFYLAVTDDEPPPWPVVSVQPHVRLPDLIGEMQYFEYFVFSKDFAGIVFDAHTNELFASS